MSELMCEDHYSEYSVDLFYSQGTECKICRQEKRIAELELERDYWKKQYSDLLLEASGYVESGANDE